MQAELVLDCKNHHGEGVLWDARTNELWWTDIQGRMLWRYDPDTGTSDDPTNTTVLQPGRLDRNGELAYPPLVIVDASLIGGSLHSQAIFLPALGGGAEAHVSNRDSITFR